MDELTKDRVVVPTVIIVAGILFARSGVNKAGVAGLVRILVGSLIAGAGMYLLFTLGG